MLYPLMLANVFANAGVFNNICGLLFEHNENIWEKTWQRVFLCTSSPRNAMSEANSRSNKIFCYIAERGPWYLKRCFDIRRSRR